MSDTGPGLPAQGPVPTGPTRRPAATPQGATAEVTGTRPEPAPAPRRVWLRPVAIGAAVLVVAGAVVGILLTRGGEEQPAPAAETVTLPPPTPTVAAAARGTSTAFAGLLPTTVLQYALTASQEDTEWLAAGAVEAYAEQLTDGGEGAVAVRAAQFATPEAAAVFAQGLVDALPAAVPDTGAPSADEDTDGAPLPDLPQTGEVLVGGQPVGTYTVVDASDGTGVAVWQNGTAVFRLVAPVADVLDAYLAYGL